jgi:hypothetical protein
MLNHAVQHGLEPGAASLIFGCRQAHLDSFTECQRLFGAQIRGDGPPLVLKQSNGRAAGVRVEKSKVSAPAGYPDLPLNFERSNLRFSARRDPHLPSVNTNGEMVNTPLLYDGHGSLSSTFFAATLAFIAHNRR